MPRRNSQSHTKQQPKHLKKMRKGPRASFVFISTRFSPKKILKSLNPVTV